MNKAIFDTPCKMEVHYPERDEIYLYDFECYSLSAYDRAMCFLHNGAIDVTWYPTYEDNDRYLKKFCLDKSRGFPRPWYGNAYGGIWIDNKDLRKFFISEE